MNLVDLANWAYGEDVSKRSDDERAEQMHNGMVRSTGVAGLLAGTGAGVLRATKDAIGIDAMTTGPGGARMRMNAAKRAEMHRANALKHAKTIHRGAIAGAGIGLAAGYGAKKYTERNRKDRDG